MIKISFLNKGYCQATRIKRNANEKHSKFNSKYIIKINIKKKFIYLHVKWLRKYNNTKIVKEFQFI
jgi:hypothetical protein